jgi:hypothetical protein
MKDNFNYSIEECFILKYLFDEYTADMNRPKVELNELHTRFFPKELKENVRLWINRLHKEGLIKDLATRGNDFLFDVTPLLFSRYEEVKDEIQEQLSKIPSYNPMFNYLEEKREDRSPVPQTPFFSGQQKFDDYKEEQKKSKFEKEQLYLLWFLHQCNRQDDNAFHDAVNIIKERYNGVIKNDIGFWVQHLEREKLVDSSQGRRQAMYVRISFDGILYVKEHFSEFEEFNDEVARGELFSEEIKSLVEQKKEGSIELKFALSTSMEDPSLKKWGLLCQGLIGYAFSQSDTPSVVLKGYFSEERDYYYYTNGIDGYDPPKLLKEQVDFNVHLIGENHSGFERSGLLNLQSFVNQNDKQVCLTQPRINALTEYRFTSNQPQRDMAVCLSKSPFKGSVSVYLYTNRPEIQLFEPLSLPEVVADKETDAELLADNPSLIDDLDRKEVIRLVTKKVNRLWDELGESDSYTILLNGEWGSGKSSMLLYFKEFLKEEWEVVEYNAWAHQHLEDQWWVLVNKVSKQISDSPDRGDINSHKWWAFKLQNHNTILVFVLAGVFLASGYGFADYFLLEGDDVTLYGSLIGLLGSIWVTFSGMVQNMFKRRVTTSELAINNSADPYKPIKDRFEAVTKNRKVAIFIDDLDRCEIKPTVALLEGIQNLFKQTKVLYVIAADGNWVSNCFDKKYQDFHGLGHSGHTIGSKFLQKSFQMILDVPKISKTQHEELWRKYLGVKEKVEEIIDEKIESDIESAVTTEQVRESAIEANTLEQRVKAAEKVEELVEKDDHRLLEYLKWIPANPRQMKRLINQFIVKYQTLIISGSISEVSEEALIRYVIFASSYPDYDISIKNGQKTLEQIKEKDDRVKELFGETELSTETILEIL